MDRVVTSKVSLQYWASIPAIIILFSFFAFLFIKYRDHGYEPQDGSMTNQLVFFSILAIIVIMTMIGVLLRPQKITISGYGILMHGNILQRQVVITKDDVQKLYVIRQNKSIKGTVTYSSRTLCIDLKNGKEVGISESSYENFESLKYAIYEYLDYINANSETAL